MFPRTQVRGKTPCDRCRSSLFHCRIFVSSCNHRRFCEKLASSPSEWFAQVLRTRGLSNWRRDCWPLESYCSCVHNSDVWWFSCRLQRARGSPSLSDSPDQWPRLNSQPRQDTGCHPDIICSATLLRHGYVLMVHFLVALCLSWNWVYPTRGNSSYPFFIFFGFKIIVNHSIFYKW